jgi:hypothetical protein
VAPLDAGGVMGRLFRVTVGYGGQRANAQPQPPKTLVAKLPSDSPPNVDLCAVYGFYHREINFYRYAPRWAELPIPKFYYGRVDGDGRRFVLLIEDLADFAPGNQLSGTDHREFTGAIDLAARMHAQFMGRLDGTDANWLVDGKDNSKPTCTYYAASLPRVHDEFGKQLSPSDRSVIDGLCEYIPRFWTEMTTPPVSLIHGDFRLENVLFGKNQAERTPRVVDFQFCGRARPAYDLGYFMSQSAQTEVRRSQERGLLERYHRAFQAAGGTGYDFETFLLDYRKAILYCLVYPVVTCGVLDMSSEPIRLFATSYLQRSLAAISDWKCAELL